MRDKLTELDLDRNGMDAANTAFMMHQSHPKGFILSNATRVRRAVAAYEWFKDHKRDAGAGYVHLPTEGDVADIVLEWERTRD